MPPALILFSLGLLRLFSDATAAGADITYFMGNPEDTRAACVAQGALQQFFQVCVCVCVRRLYAVEVCFEIRINGDERPTT